MKRVDNKNFYGVLFLAVGIMLTISLVSAGLSDWVSITGRATSGTTDASVTITGTAAVAIAVPAIPAVTATEAGSSIVTFYVTVSDADGVADIDDSSVTSNFTKGGEVDRINNSCVWVEDLDSTSANFSCTIETWYFDANGAWDIGVSATDLGNLSVVSNTTETFTINELKAMVISPASLSWAAMAPGATNQQPTDDPTLVNNTGNYAGTIDLTGLNLNGTTIASEFIGISNFTADETDGQACGAGTTLTLSPVTITGTASNPGNLSAGAGAGQEQVYYCIPSAPSVSSQSYTTAAAGGSWTIAY